MIIIFFVLVGGILNPIKKGNLLVIFTVALLAFGLSSVMASVTNSDMILNMLNITAANENTELIAVGDGSFTPLIASQIFVPVKNNTTNNTNNTNNTNTTNITSDISNYTDQAINYINNI